MTIDLAICSSSMISQLQSSHQRPQIYLWNTSSFFNHSKLHLMKPNLSHNLIVSRFTSCIFKKIICVGKQLRCYWCVRTVSELSFNTLLLTPVTNKTTSGLTCKPHRLAVQCNRGASRNYAISVLQALKVHGEKAYEYQLLHTKQNKKLPYYKSKNLLSTIMFLF